MTWQHYEPFIYLPCSGSQNETKAGNMNPVRVHPLPSTGVLLAILAGVIALVWQLNPAPPRYRPDQIPGLTYEVKRQGRAPTVELVVTSVEDGSPASKADILPGDVIDRIDGRSIESRSAVGDAIGQDRTKGVLLDLRREGVHVYKRLYAIGG